MKQILQITSKHKKLLLIFLSSILLIIATVGIVAGINSRQDNDGRRLSPATHTILKSSCLSTRYPDLCYSAIANAPSHVVEKISSQKDVIALSINLTTTAVEHNYFMVKKLIKTRVDLTTREKNALHDCLETIDETLDELQGALQDIKKYYNKNNNSNSHDKKTLVGLGDDIKTLISSAITNQVTCLDGFSHSNADRHVREALEKGQVHVEKMCSNSLAMFKNMSDTDVATSSHVSNNRQLYGQELPGWLSKEKRMLLMGEVAVDVVVATDGSGDYTTITAAVEAAPVKSKKRYVIKIKAGVYRENVIVDKKKINLMFVGEGRKNTIITGNKNVVDGWTTFDSATVAITGEGFLARDITFQNTAGPSKHQAVAIRVGSDKSAFYKCDFLAYQDTLYVHKNRQFFINCLVAGTVDFIFGNSAVVFQDCDIHARKPNPNQKNMLTAQSRSDPNQNTGIVIHKSRISGTGDLLSVKGKFETYLGRPWKEFSRTVVVMTSIDDVIHPKGWHPWDGEFGLDTLLYGEFGNLGPGSDTSGRVRWSGVKVLSKVEAQGFSPRVFVDGGSWLKSTTFPYHLDL